MAGGVVGGVVDPASPYDPDPGASLDAHGVWMVTAACAGLLVTTLIESPQTCSLNFLTLRGEMPGYREWPLSRLAVSNDKARPERPRCLDAWQVVCHPADGVADTGMTGMRKLKGGVGNSA